MSPFGLCKVFYKKKQQPQKGFKMKSTNQTHETQQDSAKIFGAIDRFFQYFHLATILNQSGIRVWIKAGFFLPRQVPKASS